jgi:hypothetical protein
MRILFVIFLFKKTTIPSTDKATEQLVVVVSIHKIVAIN